MDNDDKKAIIHKKLTKVTTRVNDAILRICMVMFAIMLVVVWLQVFMRQVLNQGLPWAEEVTKVLMIWLALLGSPVVFYEGGHISIEFIVEKLKNKKTINLLHFIISLVFSILLSISGFEYAVFGLRATLPATGIIKFWPYLAIPIGGLLLSFECFSLIIQSVIESIKEKSCIQE